MCPVFWVHINDSEVLSVLLIYLLIPMLYTCRFRSCLLALDGVAAVPEGYCCAGSAFLFPFYPVVNSGCPYGVGLFRRILAVDIEAGVGCRVLALPCENSGEVFLDCAADTFVDGCFGGDKYCILCYTCHIEAVCGKEFADGHILCLCVVCQSLCFVRG